MIFSLQLAIADIPLRLDLNGFSSDVCAKAQTKYAPFASRQEPEYFVECSSKLVIPHDRIIVEHTSVNLTRLDLPGLEGSIDWRACNIRAFARGTRLEPVENLLRTLVTEHLMRAGRGFLLHACGILEGSKAYVFGGKSEAGKTTLARKAGIERTLSDELVAVAMDERGSICAHATPFYGEMGEGKLNASAPLERLCFLDGKGSTSARALVQADALQRLLSVVLCYSGNTAAFAIARRLVEHHACVAVASMLDEPVPDIIRRVESVVLDEPKR